MYNEETVVEEIKEAIKLNENINDIKEKRIKMNKSVITIPTPIGCSSCPLFNLLHSYAICEGIHRLIDYPCSKDYKAEWCPLLPLPEKKITNITSSEEFNMKEFLDRIYNQGYNDCIEDITKRKELK